MSNYTDYKKSQENKTDPPGSETSALLETVKSIFGASPDTWLNEKMEQQGLYPGERKIAQATNFLGFLFKPYKSGFVECRTWRQNQPKPDQKWFNLAQPGWKEAFVAYAFDEEFKGKNVYFGVLPRSTPAGTNSSVKEAGCFWVDIDFKNTTPKKAKEKGADRADVIVNSGGGLHCYFLFDEPMPIEGQLLAKYQSLMTKLQRSLGGDVLVDPARILRLPGTTNFKPERAKDGVQPPVTLVQWPGKAQKPRYEQAKLMEVERVEKPVVAQSGFDL